MGNPGALAETPTIDLGHQEMERIVVELEQVYNTSQIGGQGDQWLAVEPIGNMLTHELGYEDQGEFEDALSSSFYDFLCKLPHVEVTTQADGKQMFRVKPDPPPSERKSTTLSFAVTDRKDLYRMAVKSSSGVIEVPELEFEIGSDGKKHVDTLYNHLAASVFNLSMYIQTAGAEVSDENKVKIGETVAAIHACLDVEHPFTFQLKDSEGLSIIDPADAVQVSHP